MKLSWGLFAVFLALAFVSANAANVCDLKGSWSCTGGNIVAIYFDDDDNLDLIGTSVQKDSSGTPLCTTFQKGTYTVRDDRTIPVNLPLEDCDISGNPSYCTCEKGLELSIDELCININIPSGEKCIPLDSCKEIECPNDEKAVKNSHYVPTINGCGPASIPVSAPSLSFVECCNVHDVCYPSCNTSKTECDHIFYECMACSCVEDYDDDFSQDACLELACVYFQAVDEFGCGAYETSITNSCECPNQNNSTNAKIAEYEEVPSKWGPYPPGMRKTELFCRAPFVPNCVAVHSKNSFWDWFGRSSASSCKVFVPLVLLSAIAVLFL